LHFLLDKCQKIRIISHQVSEAEKLVEFGSASTLIEMSGGWVHSVLQAGAHYLFFARAGLSKFQAFISPIPTTATEAGSPVSDDLQQTSTPP
jgi:hypothetical protein